MQFTTTTTDNDNVKKQFCEQNNSSTLTWRLLMYFFDASNTRLRRETF